MNKVKRRKNIVLIICILISVSTVGGIPMIPLGFIFGDLFSAIVGIVFVVHGFFGITFYWLWFAGLVQCYRLVKGVEQYYIYNVDELAQHLGRNRNDVARDILKCIHNEWLVGFRFDGNNIFLNENEPLKRNGVRVKCAYCDTFFMRSRNMYKCPNCGSTINEEYIEEA